MIGEFVFLGQRQLEEKTRNGILSTLSGSGEVVSAGEERPERSGPRVGDASQR